MGTVAYVLHRCITDMAMHRNLSVGSLVRDSDFRPPKVWTGWTTWAMHTYCSLTLMHSLICCALYSSLYFTTQPKFFVRGRLRRAMHTYCSLTLMHSLICCSLYSSLFFTTQPRFCVRRRLRQAVRICCSLTLIHAPLILCAGRAPAPAAGCVHVAVCCSLTLIQAPLILCAGWAPVPAAGCVCCSLYLEPSSCVYWRLRRAVRASVRPPKGCKDRFRALP